MTIAGLTGSRPWLVTGWSMLHFLWVGGALGLAAGATRRALLKAGPEARYGFALTSLMALALAPVAIVLLVNESVLPGIPRVKAPAETVNQLVPLPTALPDRSRASSAPGVVSTQDRSVLVRPDGGTMLGRLFVAAAARLPWLWLAGAPATFALLATGLVGAERLRRQSRLLVEGDPVDLCRRLADALGITRPVAMGVCERLVTPIVLGVVRPMILLPPVALTGWSPELVEMALIHELAHVRRFDILVNLVQRVVESILFFHPAVWIVSGWIRQEREHCCDRMVVDRTGRPAAYAEALFSLCSPVPAPRATAVAMARNYLVVRIRRILAPEDLSMTLPRVTLVLIAALFLIPALLIGSQVAPPSPRDRKQLDSAGTQEQEGPAPARIPGRSEERFKELALEYDTRFQAFHLANLKAKTSEEARKASRELHPDDEGYALRFLTLAREDPQAPTALDALHRVLLCLHSRNAASEAAIDQLRRDWAVSPRMAELIRPISTSGCPNAEELLRDVLAKNQDRNARGPAALALAELLRVYGGLPMARERDREALKGLERRFGKEQLDQIARRDSDTLLKESDALYERAVNEFADVRLSPRARLTVGDLASRHQARLRELVVGKPAPEIEGKDASGGPMKLSDYRGKVVALVFWASWCGPCLEDVPYQRELVKRHEGKPFALLGINIDRDPERMKAAISAQGITWRNWCDRGSGPIAGPIAARYNLEYVPTTLVVDPEGIIRATGVRGEELGKAVDTVLAGK